MRMDELSVFAASLGVSFKRSELLMEALTHRSYLNENRRARQNHNERLEFLGDAVLQLAAAHFLYETYPEKPEGELTPIRASLVREETLAELAESLGFDDALLLSKGESKNLERGRTTVSAAILADAFEAFLGALYLDQGYIAAEAFLAKHLFPKADAVVATEAWQDAKSRFQELAQASRSITPLYRTLREEGPDHDKVFTVAVFLKDEQMGEGEGRTKQEAEQAAARSALTTFEA